MKYTQGWLASCLLPFRWPSPYGFRDSELGIRRLPGVPPGRAGTGLCSSWALLRMCLQRSPSALAGLSSSLRCSRRQLLSLPLRRLALHWLSARARERRASETCQCRRSDDAQSHLRGCPELVVGARWQTMRHVVVNVPVCLTERSKTS